jgi:hypothetical protein
VRQSGESYIFGLFSGINSFKFLAPLLSPIPSVLFVAMTAQKPG